MQNEIIIILADTIINKARFIMMKLWVVILPKTSYIFINLLKLLTFPVSAEGNSVSNLLLSPNL